MKKQFVIVALALFLVLTGCAGSQKSTAVKLDKNKPVDISVWHYYNGTQKMAFDSLVSEFNETVGKDRGIYVESHSKGDVSELENAVLSSSRHEVGSDEMPNIFSAYADTAFIIDKEGMLADLSLYLSKTEQEEYEASYMDEGRIGENKGLRIFPIAKSTEVLMINETAWDAFSAATGASEEELKTTEGIARLAELYYGWTDEATPDTDNDGLAFYGRDAMANLFIITSIQKGTELFQVENQQVTLNIDREVFRQIWDTYYIPYVKGYFASYGRFRSDDVKIGTMVAYTGSTASAAYFPDQVETGDEITPITCKVMTPPCGEGGELYSVQQGAGMVVVKKTPEEEYASTEFLKWFTEIENNIRFVYASCYLPVKKRADKKEVLDKVLQEQEVSLKKKEYDTLLTAYEMTEKQKFYTYLPFEGGTDARKVLEFNLSDKAKADREVVKLRLSEGIQLDAAVSDLISPEAFDSWFMEISRALRACVE